MIIQAVGRLTIYEQNDVIFRKLSEYKSKFKCIGEELEYKHIRILINQHAICATNQYRKQSTLFLFKCHG